MGTFVDDFERFNQTKKHTASNVVFLVIACLLVVLTVVASIFSISKVSGDSMLSTIHDGDYVVCVSPVRLKHGDVVTAKVGKGKTIIKRVVARPGDKIVFLARETSSDHTKDVVTMYLDSGNGFERVQDFAMTIEGFVGQKMFTDREYLLYYGDMAFVQQKYVITIGKGEYFLLGDNRDNSLDSRHYGTFRKKDLLGKVVEIAPVGTKLYNFLNAIYAPQEFAD